MCGATRSQLLCCTDEIAQLELERGWEGQGLAKKLVEDKVPLSLIAETRLKAYVQPEHAVLPFVNDCLQKMADRRRSPSASSNHAPPQPVVHRSPNLTLRPAPL